MKRSLSIVIVVFVASLYGSFTVSAQEKLPEFGDIADLKGMSKVYVSGETTEQRKMILTELKKAPTLTVVDSPDDAEFFLDYKVVHENHPFTMMTFVTAELVAYTVKSGRKRIAWSETKALTSTGQLPRSFIKALKKARGEKV